jgi:CRP/FNR family cyclic AMP-dependent transcriptional regulator
MVLTDNGHVNRILSWESREMRHTKVGPSGGVRQDVTMAENRVDETAALPRSCQIFGKSEIIFEQGSSGSEMYLINRGRVLLSVRQDETQQVPLVVLNPGDFFGEMALVDDSPRSATASAVEDNTELIVMDRARFLFMVRQQPEFALSLMHTLCRRLREMDKRLPTEGISP